MTGHMSTAYRKARLRRCVHFTADIVCGGAQSLRVYIMWAEGIARHSHRCEIYILSYWIRKVFPLRIRAVNYK
jgi:hypothetical protein